VKRGDRIGAYEVVEQLGRGTMGVVYRVVDLQHGTEHALKVLAPESLEDTQARRRFEREMRSLLSLRGHPEIVAATEVGRTPEGAPFFVMDYVAGPSLREAIKQGLPLDRALEALEQVARALAVAHDKNFVHRDVKPENILIDAEGRARLTDFGLVRRSVDGTAGLTQAGDILGTVLYMAPEQAEPDRGETGPWTDAYSLGAILYEVLVGHPPLVAQSAVELLTKLVLSDAPVRPPRQVEPNVDPRLDAVCMRALARDPAERYRSLAELADDLAQARPPVTSTFHIGKPRAAGKPGDTDPDLPAPATGDERAIGLLKALAGVSLLLAVLSVGALVWRRASDVPDVGPATADGRVDTSALKRLLIQGEWEEVIRRGDEIQSEREEPSPEVADLVGQAHQARVTGAFKAGDSGRARDLLPAGWDRTFEELPWVLALTGAGAEALAHCPEDEPASTARIAAWIGDAEACAGALSEVEDPLERRALAWELRAYLPDLPAEPGALHAEARSGWAPVARAEEALAQGATAIAAVGFDQGLAHNPSDDRLRLACHLGLARVAAARGDLRGAAARVAEAYRFVRHPLERARCLGWALLVTVGLGEGVEALEKAAGADLFVEADRFAPGTPLVRAAVRHSAVLGVFAQDRLELPPADDTPSTWFAAAEEARARRRAPEAAAWPSGVEAELAAAARGAYGAPGLLIARGAALARLADQGRSREGSERARVLLLAATRLSPTSAAAWVELARCQLGLHRAARARQALERARALAPTDPAVGLVGARLLAAEAEPSAVEADQARCRGRPRADLDRRVAAELAAVAAAYRDVFAGAPPDEPLARQARRELAWTLLERARRHELGGEDGARREALTAAREALAPLLSGLDVSRILAARSDLRAALASGDAGAVSRAERALGAAVGPVDAEALEALLYAAAAGGPEASRRAEAFAAAVGDLPARALLALRGSELAEDGAVALRRHARELRPDLPASRLAELARRDAGDADTVLGLARLLDDAPEWVGFLTAIVYFTEDRPDIESAERLEAFLPLEAGAPADVHLARALALRTIRLFTSETPDLSDDELAALRDRNHWISTQAYLETTRALAARSGRPSVHLLRAMALSGLANGARFRARPDPHVLPDVLYDLDCATAGASWAGSVRVYQLHWNRDEIARHTAELLAQGYLSNHRHALEATSNRELVRGTVNLLEHYIDDLDLEDAEHVRETVASLRKRGELPGLALTLSVWLLDRSTRAQRTELLAGASALSVASLRPEVGWQAEARIEAALVADPDRRGSAAAKALAALHEARPLGAPLLAVPPLRVRALDARPLLLDPAWGAAIAARTMPAETALWEIWYRLQRPEAALEQLARLGAGAAADEGAWFGAAAGAPWSRARAFLLTLQEPRAQADAVAWLLERGEPEEARLALDRAAAFARGGERPDAAYRRLLAGPLRDEALALRPAAAADRLDWLVARADALVAWAGGPADRGVAADLRLDLAAVDPERRAALAEEALAAAEAAAAGEDESPIRRRWRLVRARGAVGDAAGVAAELADLAALLEAPPPGEGAEDPEDPGPADPARARAQLEAELAGDPLLPVLRDEHPALRAFLADLG